MHEIRLHVAVFFSISSFPNTFFLSKIRGSFFFGCSEYEGGKQKENGKNRLFMDMFYFLFFLPPRREGFFLTFGFLGAQHIHPGFGSVRCFKRGEGDTGK